MPKLGGKRRLGDGLDDPESGTTEAVTGQGVASQLVLYIGRQEEVCQCEIRK